MHEPGDILLFCLSAWKENTRWAAFKKAFDEIHRSHLGGQLENGTNLFILKETGHLSASLH